MSNIIDYDKTTGERFSKPSEEYLEYLKGLINMRCSVKTLPRRGMIKEFNNCFLSKVTNERIFLRDANLENELEIPHNRIDLIIFYPNQS